MIQESLGFSYLRRCERAIMGWPKESIVRCKVANRPHFKGKACFGGCGHRFVKSDRVVLVETPTNDFRGDDVVTAFCPSCFEKRQEPSR